MIDGHNSDIDWYDESTDWFAEYVRTVNVKNVVKI